MINADFKNPQYHATSIPAEAIARLLTAGLSKEAQTPLDPKADYEPLHSFALFTGGGNGCGKSTFLHGAFDRDLRLRGYALRNMDAFYTEIVRLHDDGQLLGALPAQTTGSDIEKGKAYWDAMVGLFPELDAIRTFRVPLVNMDMVGELLDDCIRHKQDDPNFLVRDHYYRALNNAPALCEALAKTKYSFVVDSTMSNPEKIIEAANSAKTHGHKINYAVFYADNAVERVMARGKREGRLITHADAVKSQQKMPKNFDAFVENARANNGFIGLYDTSAANGLYYVIGYKGDVPQLGCLNPQGAITRAHTQETFLTQDWRAFERIRHATAPPDGHVRG